MLKQLGLVGALGVLLVLAGLVIVGIFADPFVAAGIALMFAGLGVIAWALVKNVLESMGIGAML